MPAIAATAATAKPSSNTFVRSAPRMPAAATGPGVGGTSVCVASKPSAKAIEVAAILTPALRLSVLLSVERRIKPLSQKTGIDRKYPMMPIAVIILF